LEILSDDATASDLSDTAENFTWVFDHVKNNAEQMNEIVMREYNKLFA